MVDTIRARGVLLAVAALAACGGGAASVKKPPPEPEVRGAEGIAIATEPAGEEGAPSTAGGEPAGGEQAGEAHAGGAQEGGGEAPAVEEHDPKIRLLSSGHGERRPLRYRPSAGSSARRLADVEIDARIDMGGATHDIPTTRLRVTGDTRIDAVGATGDVEFTSEIVDVQAQGGPPDTATYAEQFEGMTATRTVSNRGVAVSGGFAGSQIGNADAERLIDRLTGLSGAPPPLPGESIGVGARWEEESRVDIQGVILEIVTTSELTALSGDRATIKFSSSMTIDARAVAQPGMTWKDIAMSESGTFELDLKKLVPEIMVREARLEAAMGMDGGGGDTGLKVTFRVDARTQ